MDYSVSTEETKIEIDETRTSEEIQIKTFG